jgi:hypothetical protein
MAEVMSYKYDPSSEYDSESEEYSTFEEALEAVKDDISKLLDLPEKFLTREMFLAAVEHDGAALLYIKKEARTHEICMAAVQNDGTLLCLVPKEVVSYAMCLAAVRSGVTEDDGYTAIHSVPDKFITPELCYESVMITPNSIEFIKNPSVELCLLAIREDPDVLEVIENQTLEMCFEAVKQDGSVLEYVKPELQTYELYVAASKAKKYGQEAIKYVTPEIKQIIKKKYTNKIKKMEKVLEQIK